MTLIKSISGIRGTIGGKPGDGLSPLDIVKFCASFVTFLKQHQNKEKLTLIVGRDARISGEMVNHIVLGTLMGMGVDVIDTGLSTTPTVEMTVIEKKADGGIILTASHNPRQWNALKLLNHRGEFISAEDGAEVLSIAANNAYSFTEVEHLGSVTEDNTTIDMHIEKILALSLVDCDAIKNANFKVAIDCVNSTGGIALPKLLKSIRCKEYRGIVLYTEWSFPS